MTGCWYCHAVSCDTCPKCGMTRDERLAERAFYASFRPVVRLPSQQQEPAEPAPKRRAR